MLKMLKLCLIPIVFMWISLSLGIVEKLDYDFSLDSAHDVFLNYGTKKIVKSINNNLQNSIFKSKIEVLANVFRKNINAIKFGNNEVDLVFLIDASSSVGEDNFRSEIKFVKKLLSDFSVSFNTTRVALVTFSSQISIVKNVDQISNPTILNNKCRLLKKQLPEIKYSGGGTYTLGAFIVAQRILEKGRKQAKKVIFLITDGYSNGGDPVPVAEQLKKDQVTIFTIGVRNGNFKELFDISSQPGQYFSYLLDSYSEFESLARRALHSDLQNGEYEKTEHRYLCDNLCDRKRHQGSCCDSKADCSCGLSSGQYSCMCKPGYYGSGLVNSCQFCPNGTFADGSNVCRPCPDINHIILAQPALNVSYCQCKIGYKATADNKCAVITCPELKPPKHGYFVKKSECSNILNNACGVRCRVGYQMEGDSIRLCQMNASWSGNEPVCKAITCPLLKSPKNGIMRCVNENNERISITSKEQTSVPLDSQCKFKCQDGYRLVGSKIRYCLPLSKWDGLNTSCKRLKCSRLSQIQFGMYEPKTCTLEKQFYGDTCSISCQKGFILKGPSMKTCTGKFGHWSNKTQTICQDISPPVLKCPKNINGTAIWGKSYGFVSWVVPNITDNSGLNVTYWTKPVIKSLNTFKFRIGTTTITYFAVDAFKNKAKCSFTVEVIDGQPPTMENCNDPPVFLSENGDGANITWDEPNIYDNSQKKVEIYRTHNFGLFPIGGTKVTYIATDPWNNTNSCTLVINVKESKCQPMPDPMYGETACKESKVGLNCVITCSEGYAFDISTDLDLPSSSVTNVLDNSTELVCHHDAPIWSPLDQSLTFPECSVTEVPSGMVQTGSFNIETDLDICQENSTLKELENEISGSLSEILNEECNDVLSCKVNSKLLANCGDESESVSEEDINTIPAKGGRWRRNTRVFTDKAVNKKRLKKRRQRINVIFTIDGKPKEFSKIRHINYDKFKKIQDRVKSVSLFLTNNSTISKKFENAQIFIDFKIEELIAICANGSVNKRGRCVRCARGTFHNITRRSCQSCPIGFYNEKIGQITCTPCPKLTSTRRINSKSLEQCKAECSPGTFARNRTLHHTKHLRKPESINNVSLAPFCKSCDLNFYQSDYGRTECVACPDNYITLGYSSKWREDCIPSLVSICHSANRNICNNGTCVLENENAYYSCECADEYMGSNCEFKFDVCASNPCLNDGKCVPVNISAGSTGYLCDCTIGFTGDNCEEIDIKCLMKKCQNGGTCMKVDNDEFCLCENKYSGELCEQDIRHCQTNICENGGDCVDFDEGFFCVCKNGFTGKRCDLLPCDYLPCESENHICINLMEKGTSPLENYRCECPMGFKGQNCTGKINYCAENTCQNNGTCISKKFTFVCNCQRPFTGLNCLKKLDSKYVLKFPKSGISDFVKVPGSILDLTELSVCVWVKTSDTLNYGTIFSYATAHVDNAFTLTDYSGIVLYVNGQYKVTDITLNDGRWHFICVTWQSTYGSYYIYVDGKIRVFGQSLGNSTVMKGGGALILGQEQDEFGGQFSQSESFTGRIANLDIWNVVLNQSQVLKLYKNCESYHGNVYAWGQFAEFIHGDVQIEKWPFCEKCGEPKLIRDGKIKVENNLAVYSCRPGYVLSYFGKKFYRIARKCDKTSQWEGVLEPKCLMITCNHPGHFANGYIQGDRYNYGDIVVYSCRPNFELVGLTVRECLQNGTWSYYAPFCLGAQCKQVEQPGSSYMTVITEQKYEDQTLRDTYDVGTQIEFGCLEGAVLVGESLITCLDNGTWDSPPPVCVEFINTTTELSITSLFIDTSTTVVGTVLKRLPVQKKCDGADLCVQENITARYNHQDVITEDSSDSHSNATTGELVDHIIDTSHGFSNNNLPIINKSVLNVTLSAVEISTNSIATKESINSERTSPIIVASQFCIGDELPFLPENGYYVNKKSEIKFYKIGANVEYKCREGFFYSQEVNSTICLENGTWSLTHTFCKPITCNAPLPRKHMQLANIGLQLSNSSFVNVTYYAGNMIRYECAKGYEGFGKDIIRCQSNGRWNRLLLRCFPITCNKPTISGGAKIIGNSYLYEAKLMIECSEHGETNTWTIQCKANKTWLPEVKC